MKRLTLFIVFVLASTVAGAQAPSYGEPTATIFVNTAPKGTCTAGTPNQQVVSTGVMYSCQNGTWGASGGGSGNVTGPSSSTAGDLPSFSDTTGKVLQDSGASVANGIIELPIVPGAQAEYLAWKDGSGTTLTDQSGNGYNCTFAGAQQPTWNSTGTGVVLAYPNPSNSTSSYLTCPIAAIDGAETIQVFFKPTIPQTASGAKYNVLVGDSGGHGFGLVSPRGDIFGQLTANTAQASAPLYQAVGNTSITMTCPPSSPASFYVNGNYPPAGTLQSVNCPAWSTTGSAYIGTYAGFGSTQFSGTIYAILIYPTVLTQAEAKQNYLSVTGTLNTYGVQGFTDYSPPSLTIFDGDSRMFNFSDGTYEGSRPYYISQIDPQYSHFFNVGWTGYHAYDLITAARLDAVEYPLISEYTAGPKTILLDIGTNDLAAGYSASTIFGDIQTFCTDMHNAAPGIKVITSTVLGVAGFTAAEETQREALNSDMVSGQIAGTYACDGVDDIAGDPVMGTQVVPNNYNPTGASYFNPTWYESPGIHETALANQEMSTQEAFSMDAAQNRVKGCRVIDKQVPYQVLVQANTASPSTSQAVTLLQLFPGWQVCSFSANVKTAFAGTSVTALTMSVGDSGGTATQYLPSTDLFTTGTTVASPNTFTSNSGVVQMHFTATGGNLSAMTAGEVDV